MWHASPDYAPGAFLVLRHVETCINPLSEVGFMCDWSLVCAIGMYPNVTVVINVIMRVICLSGKNGFFTLFNR